MNAQISRGEVKSDDVEAVTALSAASEAAQNEQLGTDTVKYLDAKEETQKGALFICMDLEEAFGDKLKGWPIPDSDTGNNPDKRTVTMKDPKSGEMKSVKTSFYTDFCAALPVGKEIDATLAKLDAAKNGEKNEFTTLATYQATSIRRRYEGRRTALRGLFKRAMKLHFQMEAVNSLEHVQCKIATIKGKDDVEELLNTTYPMVSYDRREPVNAKVASISTFISYDVDEARSKGGTLEALLETAGRGGNGGGETEVEPLTIDTFEETAAAMLHFIEGKGIAALYKRINTKPEESNDLVETLGDLYQELDKVWPKIEDRYNRLQAGKAMDTKVA